MNHDQQTVMPHSSSQEGRTHRAAVLFAVVAALAVTTACGAGTTTWSPLTDDGAHRLTAPTTLLDGKFRKSADGAPVTDGDLRIVGTWGGHDVKGVGATYQEGTSLTARILTYSGLYGTFDDPGKAVDAWLAQMKAEAGDHTFVGSPEQFTPSGFDNGVMKCQQVESRDVVTQTDPVCVWGDHTTLGLVTTHPPRLGAASATVPTPLGDAAELTVEVREQVRVKA